MTTQRELSRINKLVDIIIKEGCIGKVHLVMISGISIPYFEKLKPYMLEIYDHKIRYDRDTKTFQAIPSQEITNTH